MSENTFTMTRGGEAKTFDSFECAIHMMAPTCSNCRCRVLGHGVESETKIYCCAHWARQPGRAQAMGRA